MGKLIKGPWSVVDEDSDNLILPTDEIDYVAFDADLPGDLIVTLPYSLMCRVPPLEVPF